MRNALFGAAALAVIGLLAGPARAEEMMMMNDKLGFSLRGELVFGFFGHDHDNSSTYVSGNESTATPFVYESRDTANFSIESDGEIDFHGRMILDSGLKIGAKVELNLDAELDEHLIYFEGGFGKLVIGAAEGAAEAMHYTVPSYTPEGDTAIFGVDFPEVHLGRLSAPNTTYVLDDPDPALKIAYYSPRVAGFKLGLSYTPEAGDTGDSDGNVRVRSSSEISDFIIVGANYHGEVGNDIKVGLSVTYGTGDAPDVRDFTSDPRAYAFGARLHWRDFEIGGAWYAGDSLDQNNASSFQADSRVWTLGVAYGQGPWKIGVAYRSSELKRARRDEENIILDTGQDDPVLFEDEYENEMWDAGLRYELGGGLTMGFNFQYTEDTNPNPFETGTREVENYSVGYILALNF